MKYMIASDFDGTLSQGGISEETLEAIKEFRRRGNFFGVVTGRDFHWSYEIFKENDMFPFDFIISNNGGQGWDENGECIFRYYIENVPLGNSTLAEELVKSNLSLSGIDSGIALEKTRLAFHPDLPDGGRVEGEPYDFLPISSLHTLDRFVSSNVICENDEVARQMTENLEEKAGCPIDLEEAEESAAEEVVAKREEALAKQLAEMKHRKRKLVDPLQFEMSIQAEDLSGYGVRCFILQR